MTETVTSTVPVVFVQWADVQASLSSWLSQDVVVMTIVFVLALGAVGMLIRSLLAVGRW